MKLEACKKSKIFFNWLLFITFQIGTSYSRQNVSRVDSQSKLEIAGWRPWTIITTASVSTARYAISARTLLEINRSISLLGEKVKETYFNRGSYRIIAASCYVTDVQEESRRPKFLREGWSSILQKPCTLIHDSSWITLNASEEKARRGRSREGEGEEAMWKKNRLEKEREKKKKKKETKKKIEKKIALS